MHSIIFARRISPAARTREVRVTEKVERDAVKVYSRRKTAYKVILEDVQIPVEKLKLKPETYIYRNIQDKRKFYSWKIQGIVKMPRGRNKSCLVAYEHSFWMLLKDQSV